MSSYYDVVEIVEIPKVEEAHYLLFQPLFRHCAMLFGNAAMKEAGVSWLGTKLTSIALTADGVEYNFGEENTLKELQQFGALCAAAKSIALRLVYGCWLLYIDRQIPGPCEWAEILKDGDDSFLSTVYCAQHNLYDGVDDDGQGGSDGLRNEEWRDLPGRGALCPGCRPTGR